MLKRLVLAGVFLAGSVAAASSMTLEEALDPYVKKGLARYTDGSASKNDRVVTISNLVARGQGVDAGTGKIVLTETENGHLAISIDAMNLVGTVKNSPQVHLGGVSIEIEKAPDLAQASMLCAWLDVARVIRADQVEILFPPGSGYGAASLRARNVGYELRGQDIPRCHLSGLVSLDNAEATFENRSAVSLLGLHSQIRFPMSTDVVGHEKSAPAFRMQLADFEFRNGAEFPAYGVGDLSVSGNLAADSVGGLVRAFEGGTLFTSERNGQEMVLSLVNGLAGLSGDATFQTDNVRVLTPGIVPPEMVANFSRVGLSTIRGSASGNLLFRSGPMALSTTVDLVGVASMELQSTLLLKPYAAEKFALARKGLDLGVHMTPDLSLVDLEFGYKDEGLEHYVVDLTGIPIGRNVTEFGRMIVAGATEDLKGTIQVAIDEAAAFFRHAADHKEMRVFAQPGRPVSLPEILLAFLRDSRDLDSLLNLTMVANTRSEDAP